MFAMRIGMRYDAGCLANLEKTPFRSHSASRRRGLLGLTLSLMSSHVLDFGRHERMPSVPLSRRAFSWRRVLRA